MFNYRFCDVKNHEKRSRRINIVIDTKQLRHYLLYFSYDLNLWEAETCWPHKSSSSEHIRYHRSHIMKVS